MGGTRARPVLPTVADRIGAANWGNPGIRKVSLYFRICSRRRYGPQRIPQIRNAQRRVELLQPCQCLLSLLKPSDEGSIAAGARLIEVSGIALIDSLKRKGEIIKKWHSLLLNPVPAAHPHTELTGVFRVQP